jgi:hypothetical protein
MGYFGMGSAMNADPFHSAQPIRLGKAHPSRGRLDLSSERSASLANVSFRGAGRRLRMPAMGAYRVRAYSAIDEDDRRRHSIGELVSSSSPAI